MNIAKNINDSIANKIRAINRGAKSDGSADVGTLFILRNANMPAVLVEVGFITNKEEAIRCADPASQKNYDKLQELDLDYYNKTRTGYIMARIIGFTLIVMQWMLLRKTIV